MILARSLGYDAGKRVKGRKRHILVDTLGVLLNVVVHPADVQDRDGAFLLLRRARRLFPFIKRIFADGGYAGKKMALVVWRTGAWKLGGVKRSDVSGFEVLPKRSRASSMPRTRRGRFCAQCSNPTGPRYPLMIVSYSSLAFRTAAQTGLCSSPGIKRMPPPYSVRATGTGLHKL